MKEIDTASVSEQMDLELLATDDALSEAFERILDAAERLLDLKAHVPAERTSAFDAAVGEILEASAVRDIAGQRIGNLRSAVRALREGRAPAPQGDGLLNGPAEPDAAPSQDEVDALFDGTEARR